MKEGILFSDWANICPHSDSYMRADAWGRVPYTTAEHTGELLVAFTGCSPADVVIRPELTGWHRIYVCMMIYENNMALLKLSSDDAYELVVPTRSAGWDEYTLEEGLWRCENMTGKTLTISRSTFTEASNTILAWIRFVPMSDQEAAAWKADFSHKEDKRLYANNDMHNMLYSRILQSVKDWHTVVDAYRDSDVEWVSMENMLLSTADAVSLPEDLIHVREGDRWVTSQRGCHYTPEMLRELVELAHNRDLKVCSSLRMNCWIAGFPYVNGPYDNQFYNNHLNLRCVDRDGTPVERMSYAFEEVQQQVIDSMVYMARLGFDAVGLLYNRGMPYLLYEQPVADRFFAEYGEYPYELPLADPRLNRLHRQMMTEFMQKLRRALDEATGKGKVQIHAQVMNTLNDCHLTALDPEEWARQGLVDVIISYPRAMYEVLEGDIWRDDAHTRLDLDKFRAYVRSASGELVLDPDLHNRESQIIPERVAEFIELERTYGVKVYFTVMPRVMPPAEFTSFVEEMYRLGAERFSLWDTQGRAAAVAMWSVVRRLGHKEQVLAGQIDNGSNYRHYRMLTLANRQESRFKSLWGS